MPVLAAISPRLSPWALRSRANSTFFAGWATGRPMCRFLSSATGAGVSSSFGAEGALHLGEQSQEEESDATRTLVGGVDRQRVR